MATKDDTEMYMLYKMEGILKLNKKDVDEIINYFADTDIDRMNHNITKWMIHGGGLPITLGFRRKHKGVRFLPFHKNRKFILREK